MDTQRLDRNNLELRPRVLTRLEEAREALEVLVFEQHEYINAPEKVEDRLAFNPKPVQREHRDIYELDALHETFGTLEAQLRAHLEEEAATVYPALRTFLRDGGNVDALLDAQRQAHVELLRFASAVRRESTTIPPMRKPMGALLQHLEKQIQYEETRIFPELLGTPIGEDTPIPNRYRTSTDVANSLRRARPPRPEPEPEPTGFLTSFFKKWVKNR